MPADRTAGHGSAASVPQHRGHPRRGLDPAGRVRGRRQGVPRVCAPSRSSGRQVCVRVRGAEGVDAERQLRVQQPLHVPALKQAHQGHRSRDRKVRFL